MIWPWQKRECRQAVIPSRPDGFTDRRQFYTRRPQPPVNNPASTNIEKVVDTVPSGERREMFTLTGPGTFLAFQNQTGISVEVNEIFVFGIVAGNFSILLDEQAQTPVIPIAANQMYSDSGFRLPISSSVNISLTGATEVSGFVRWRYT